MTFLHQLVQQPILAPTRNKNDCVIAVCVFVLVWSQLMWANVWSFRFAAILRSWGTQTDCMKLYLDLVEVGVFLSLSLSSSLSCLLACSQMIMCIESWTQICSLSPPPPPLHSVLSQCFSFLFIITEAKEPIPISCVFIPFFCLCISSSPPLPILISGN